MFITDSNKSNICDYSNACILVKDDITVEGGNANTKVTFKNCIPFKACQTKINYVFC